MLKKVHVILNPASGSRSAAKIYEEEVLSYINKTSSKIDIIKHTTASQGDASKIAKQIVEDSKGQEVINIVALGGDGTTHEIVNGLVLLDERETCRISARVDLALVPTGTANALFESLYANADQSEAEDKLRSLKALLHGDDTPLPLALSLVTYYNDAEKHSLIAHLITSHALHASILADSEELRAEHPGIERFKMAFAKNMSKWVPATLTLRPLQSGNQQDEVLQYDPTSGQFKAIPSSETIINDQFSYFACMTTDRLEPKFVPAPYSGPFCKDEAMKRAADALDIVLFRPLRNPRLAGKAKAMEGKESWLGQESEEIRQKVAESHLVQISSLMYQEGKHVDLTYGTDDDLESNGEGTTVCEYLRCSGYEWTPSHASARRVCIDGTVLEADRVQVRVLSREEGAGQIRVHH